MRPDVVVPVPMHWRRRLMRGTNSPAIVAERLAGPLAGAAGVRLAASHAAHAAAVQPAAVGAAGQCSQCLRGASRISFERGPRAVGRRHSHDRLDLQRGGQGAQEGRCRVRGRRGRGADAASLRQHLGTIEIAHVLTRRELCESAPARASSRAGRPIGWRRGCGNWDTPSRSSRSRPPATCSNSGRSPTSGRRACSRRRFSGQCSPARWTWRSTVSRTCRPIRSPGSRSLPCRRARVRPTCWSRRTIANRCNELPESARVGTGSLRRQAQLRYVRPRSADRKHSRQRRHAAPQTRRRRVRRDRAGRSGAQAVGTGGAHHASAAVRRDAAGRGAGGAGNRMPRGRCATLCRAQVDRRCRLRMRQCSRSGRCWHI